MFELRLPGHMATEGCFLLTTAAVIQEALSQSQTFNTSGDFDNSKCPVSFYGRQYSKLEVSPVKVRGWCEWSIEHGLRCIVHLHSGCLQVHFCYFTSETNSWHTRHTAKVVFLNLPVNDQRIFCMICNQPITVSQSLKEPTVLANDWMLLWQLTCLWQYVARWLACTPCNSRVWGPKPPWALRALPHYHNGTFAKEKKFLSEPLPKSDRHAMVFYGGGGYSLFCSSEDKVLADLSAIDPSTFWCQRPDNNFKSWFHRHSVWGLL